MPEESKESQILWGGRFAGETDPLMQKFKASSANDKKMFDSDLAGKYTQRGFVRLTC